MLIAGTASDALDMGEWTKTMRHNQTAPAAALFRRAFRSELSPALFPLFLPDQFVRISAALVVLGAGLTVLVFVAALAIRETSGTEDQTRHSFHECNKSGTGGKSSRGDWMVGSAPRSQRARPKRST
jgi:hypothetical protein